MPNLTMSFEPSMERVGTAFRGVAKSKNIQKDLDAFAYMVEAESKRTSPIKTGRMRGSIATKLNTLSAVIGPHVHYAGFVHWGTRRMAARPFMKWGLQKASMIRYKGKVPFAATVEKTFKEEFKKI